MDFPVRPPVPGVSGRLPWSPGQILSDAKAATPPSAQLTPFEVAELTKLGWRPGDPLPSVAAQAKKIAAEAAVPLPVDPATAPPPLVPPDPVDISALPPAVRDDLLAWLTAVGRTAPPPTELPVAPPPVAPPPAAAPDALDAVEYLRAILAGEPFRREYSLFGGSLAVEFRTLTADEDATVRSDDERLWLSLDRVRAAGTAGKGTPSQSATGDRAGWLETVPILRGAPAVAAVRKTYEAFLRLVESLTAAADDPNFWPATAR